MLLIKILIYNTKTRTLWPMGIYFIVFSVG